jgi:hypothetical protein
MILRHRSTAPPKLADARDRELPEVRRIVEAGGTPSSKDFTGYRVVSEDLWTAQHHHCALCDAPTGHWNQDVEHFRPKTVAIRGGAFPTYGYWWLAWEWTNLSFACQLCNRRNKGSAFPLHPGSAVLAPESLPPGGEQPLLVDPFGEIGHPLDHIRYVPVTGAVWKPSGISPEGRKTVEVLGLASDELIARYSHHYREYLISHVGRIRAALDRGDQDAVRLAWDDALQWVRPQRSFPGLAFSVLDHFFPVSRRDELGLQLVTPAG